jgi:hypothetical protein
LVAPRIEFEQRLGLGLGAWLRYGPRLSLPSLHNGLFEQDAALPGIRNRPSRESVNAEAGLSASLPWQLGLELKGFLVQNEDANFLDDPAGIGLWRMTNVRGSRRGGVELGLRLPLEGGYSLDGSLAWQHAELIDSLGQQATFVPALKAGAWLSWKGAPYSAAIGVAHLSERQGRLAGGDTLPAYTDLRARAAYDWNESVSLLFEASNLLSQRVQEFSGYAEASPYLGGGLEYRF